MNTTRFRFLKNKGILTFVLLLLVGAFGACSTITSHVKNYRQLRSYAKEAGDERDLSLQRISENGVFRATIKPQADPIPLNQLHSWTLHIETTDSTTIDAASIAVDGGMPEHGHGLPTRPQVTQALGNGNYFIEGMKFQMPGWWIVQFNITSPEGTDTVTFNLTL